MDFQRVREILSKAFLGKDVATSAVSSFADAAAAMESNLDTMSLFTQVAAEQHNLKFCFGDDEISTQSDFRKVLPLFVWFAGSHYMELTKQSDNVGYELAAEEGLGVRVDCQNSMGGRGSLSLFLLDSVIKVGKEGIRSEVILGAVDLEPMYEQFKLNMQSLLARDAKASGATPLGAA